MSKSEKPEMIWMLSYCNYPSRYLVKQKDETPCLGLVGNSCESLKFTVSQLINFLLPPKCPPYPAAVHLLQQQSGPGSSFNTNFKECSCVSHPGECPVGLSYSGHVQPRFPCTSCPALLINKPHSASTKTVSPSWPPDGESGGSGGLAKQSDFPKAVPQPCDRPAPEWVC